MPLAHPVDSSVEQGAGGAGGGGVPYRVRLKDAHHQGWDECIYGGAIMALYSPVWPCINVCAGRVAKLRYATGPVVWPGAYRAGSRALKRPTWP